MTEPTGVPTGEPGMGVCDLGCGPVPTHDLVNHIRVMHPDEYAESGGLVEWPDGAPVIIDETLTPDEFAGGNP